MEFQEITDNSKVYPGEYLLHQPSQQIVLCGAYIKTEGIIRVLRQGRLLEDRVENFRKIQLNKTERKESAVSRCGGCKSK